MTTNTADTFTGSAGAEEVDVDLSASPAIVSNSWEADDTLSGINNLIGSDYGDILTGNDRLDGHDGNDNLNGGGGSDTPNPALKFLKGRF